MKKYIQAVKKHFDVARLEDLCGDLVVSEIEHQGKPALVFERPGRRLVQHNVANKKAHPIEECLGEIEAFLA